jgi:putative flippase GtrA
MARLGVPPAAAVPPHWLDALRYVVAGGTVAVFNLGLALLLSGPGDVPIQLAIPVAYVLALCLHFSLQRWFVFAHEQHALAITHQIRRYLPAAAAQYGFAAATTAVVPGLIGAPEGVVYSVAVVVSSAGTFLFLRARVFHPDDEVS